MPSSNRKPQPVTARETPHRNQLWPDTGRAKINFDSDADTAQVTVDLQSGLIFDGEPTLAFTGVGCRRGRDAGGASAEENPRRTPRHVHNQMSFTRPSRVARICLALLVSHC